MPLKNIIYFFLFTLVASGFASCSSDDDEGAPDPIVGYWLQAGSEIDLRMIAPEEHQKSVIEYLNKNFVGVINESYLWFHQNGICNNNGNETKYLVKDSLLYIDYPINSAALYAKTTYAPTTVEYKMTLENSNNKLKVGKLITPGEILYILKEAGKNTDGIEITSAMVTCIYRRELIYATE